MELATLIDLEARIAVDERRDPAELHERDRVWWRGLQDPPTARNALLRLWARAERPTLGTRVEAAWRTTGVIVGALGILMGGTTARVLLQPGAAHPTNLFYYLAVVVGLQVTALLLFAGVALLSRRWPHLFDHLPGSAEVRGLVRALTDRLSRSASTETRLTLARLRVRAPLYASLERWEVLRVTQLFGVAFNLGVLGVFLALVTFSELTFGWSTTLADGGAWVGQVVRILAMPFGWLVAPPSDALIAATQYSTMTSGYTAEVSAHAAGRWWPFLFAATLTYGLLPRLGLWLWSVRGRHRALAEVPLDTPDLDAVIRRMRTPIVALEGSPTRSPAPSPVAGGATAADDAPAPDLSDPRAYLVIRWREFPAPSACLARVVEHLDGTVRSEARAGDGDPERDRQTAAQAQGPVVLFVEDYEAPDRETRAFLRTLRDTVGPRAAILIAVTGEAHEGGWDASAPASVAVWRELLAELGDPYLRVEAQETAC